LFAVHDRLFCAFKKETGIAKSEDRNSILHDWFVLSEQEYDAFNLVMTIKKLNEDGKLLAASVPKVAGGKRPRV